MGEQELIPFGQAGRPVALPLPPSLMNMAVCAAWMGEEVCCGYNRLAGVSHSARHGAARRRRMPCRTFALQLSEAEEGAMPGRTIGRAMAIAPPGASLGPMDSAEPSCAVADPALD